MSSAEGPYSHVISQWCANIWKRTS